ncbi:MAG: hypothetical protein HZB39_13680 [Planctomycetes bacterium]|nr:hypothetical protein [Planctomycetota bacterium]
MRTSIILSLALLPLFLGACGSGSAASSAAGKWSLDPVSMSDMILKQQEKELAALPADERAKMEAMVKEQSKAMKGDLTIGADNTFTVTMDMGPMHSEVKGTWKLDGNRIAMTGKEVGKDKEETMFGALDGDRLTVEGEQGGQKMAMTFVRAK